MVLIRTICLAGTMIAMIDMIIMMIDVTDMWITVTAWPVVIIITRELIPIGVWDVHGVWDVQEGANNGSVQKVSNVLDLLCLGSPSAWSLV